MTISITELIEHVEYVNGLNGKFDYEERPWAELFRDLALSVLAQYGHGSLAP